MEKLSPSVLLRELIRSLTRDVQIGFTQPCLFRLYLQRR